MAIGLHPIRSGYKSKTNGRKAKRSKFPDPVINRDTGGLVRFMNIRTIGWAPTPKNTRALNGILSVGEKWTEWHWETTVRIASNRPCEWGCLSIRPPREIGIKRTFSKKRLIRIGAKSKRSKPLTQSETIALFVARSLVAFGNKSKSVLRKNMAYEPPTEHE